MKLIQPIFLQEAELHLETDPKRELVTEDEPSSSSDIPWIIQHTDWELLRPSKSLQL